MENQTAYDYMAMFVALAALAVGLISMAVGKVQAIFGGRSTITTTTRRARRALPTHQIMSRQAARIVTNADANPNATVQASFPLLNGVEPQSEPFVNRAELHLNADEIAAVARMVDHNRTAAKPSKSSTIGAGFGVSRGGSQAYQRASAIYDALFGPPAPAVQYRELTPDRQQILKQNGALN